MLNNPTLEMAELIMSGTKSLTDTMVKNDDSEALVSLAMILKRFAQELNGIDPGVDISYINLN